MKQNFCDLGAFFAFFAFCMLSIMPAHAGGGVWPGGIGVLDVIAHYYPLATSVVGTAAIAAALTPSQWDNKFIAGLRAILDFVGANFLGAKNENKKR